MAKKRFSPEQIITMLWEAEVLLNQATLASKSIASWGSLNRPIIGGGRNTAE